MDGGLPDSAGAIEQGALPLSQRPQSTGIYSAEADVVMLMCGAHLRGVHTRGAHMRGVRTRDGGAMNCAFRPRLGGMSNSPRIEFDPTGAHITDIGDVLYTSPTTQRMPDAPIRGGIPLIGPQFGTRMAATYPELPSHGVLRRQPWVVDTATPTALKAHLRHAGIDYSYTVDVTVQEGQDDATRGAVTSFRCVLEAHNTTETPVEVQIGFHPYFAVEEITHTQVRGVQGTAIADFRGDGEFRPASRDVITFDEQGYDRGVRGVHSLTIVDGQGGRDITVRSESADIFVVWNPGVEQAAAFGDMPDDGWHDFVCVEPMIHGAAGDGELLPAGGELRLDMTVDMTPHTTA